MRLESWIARNGGVKKTAKILGIRHPRIYPWIHEGVIPRAEMLKAIVQKSGGRVTYSEIVDSVLSHRAKLKYKVRAAKPRPKRTKKAAPKKKPARKPASKPSK